MVAYKLKLYIWSWLVDPLVLTTRVGRYICSASFDAPSRQPLKALFRLQSDVKFSSPERPGSRAYCTSPSQTSFFTDCYRECCNYLWELMKLDDLSVTSVSLRSSRTYATVFILHKKCPIHIGPRVPRSKMPFAFIPKSLANTSRTAPVTDIYICADEPNAVSGSPKPGPAISGPMTNHWVMYFVASATKLFCFDPSPSGLGNTLDLIISNKSYVDIFSAVKVVRLTPSAKLTIGRVYDHITDSKFDNYTFSPGGQGCRFWICSVVASLRSVGYITNSSEVNASTKALEVVWTARGNPVPAGQQTGIAQGTF